MHGMGRAFYKASNQVKEITMTDSIRRALLSQRASWQENLKRAIADKNEKVAEMCRAELYAIETRFSYG